MSVSQQTAKKFFSLQSRCGLNASRHLFAHRIDFNKAMKIIFILWKVRGTTGAWRMLSGSFRCVEHSGSLR